MDNPIIKYIGFIVGFVTSVLTVLAPVFGYPWFDANIAWALAGIFTFGNVAALRTFILSKGWKTHILVGGQILSGLLLAFNVFTLEVYASMVALLGTLTGATILQAKVKEAKVVK